jgi:hypothetical protein
MPYQCMSTRDLCVHTWSGVPNLVAVFIADGGTSITSGLTVPSPGIGREKLALLYFETLTGGRLATGSNFLSQRLATISECHDLVSSGQTFRGSQPFTTADCDQVALAFDAAGITASPQYGWTRFDDGLSGPWSQRVMDGQRLFNGCTVADQILTLWTGNAKPRSSNVANGLLVNMLTWFGYVTDRAAATDPTDRSATVNLMPVWLIPDAQFLFADRLAVPAGQDPGYCHTPAPVVPNIQPPPRSSTAAASTRW